MRYASAIEARRVVETVAVGDVERRLIRAIRLDIAMPDREHAALHVKANWPAYVHDRADLNCQAENADYLAELRRDAKRLREWDTRPAREDYLDAMGWLTRKVRERLIAARLRGQKPTRKKGKGLDEVRFARLVAWGHSFKTIGEQDGTSEQQAARRWAGIVETCHAIANGWEWRLKSSLGPVRDDGSGKSVRF